METETSSHHPTIFICVLISLHDANLPEQVIMGVGFVREQVGIMIGYAESHNVTMHRREIARI